MILITTIVGDNDNGLFLYNSPIITNEFIQVNFVYIGDFIDWISLLIVPII